MIGGAWQAKIAEAEAKAQEQVAEEEKEAQEEEDVADQGMKQKLQELTKTKDDLSTEIAAMREEIQKY